MDFLVIGDGCLRKASEFQTTFSSQAVGVSLAAECGETVLYEFVWVVKRDSLLDVDFCRGARLDGRRLKRDERSLAVGQVQRGIEGV